MLSDFVFISINLNQWSNILRRALEFNFISCTYRCSADVFFKNMSKESDTCDLVGTPSTSGSSPNSWNNSSNTVDNSNTNTNQHLNETNELRTEEYTPNLVLAHPFMCFQGVPSNFYNLNFYPTNNFFYMADHFSQSFRHCQTDREYRQIGHAQQRNGSASKVRINSRLSLFILYFLFTCISGAMENGCEEKTDQRLSSIRKWENVSNENQSSRPGFIFTLMCYNVLAQDLVVQHPYLYNRHDRKHLDWNTRWTNIYQEIVKFKPDVLCLQEVQDSHINNYFSILDSIGYSGIYKRRTGERCDGCALYYKTDVIQLVEHTSVEYFQPNITILNRDNIGLIAKFSPKLHPTREFVIATTHLLYNPRRQDVRLAQMQLLLTEIERLSYNTKSENNYVPIILTGDLNSTPDSPIYEFIAKGKLKYEHLSPRSLHKGTNTFMGKILVPADLRITDNCQHVDLLEKRLKNESISRSDEKYIIELFHSEKNDKKPIEKKEIDSKLFSTGTLSHNFAFKSVYNHGKPENNEGTTFQGEWVTVDYIFYSTKKDHIKSEHKLKLLSRYRLPTKEELRRINIPNSEAGSDHLSLLAKFKLEY